ncbi:MAG: hypothetical protein GC192_07360 [Bacteroidetes bacterium]|nr:hypothetical protein [Bacteroidota bacterium]
MEEFVFVKAKAINEAKDYLNKNKAGTLTDAELEDVKALAEAHYQNSSFTYARRLFQLLYIRNKGAGIFEANIIKRLAICTYKDTDLSSDVKFDAASQLLLGEFGNGGDVADANVLGILGSIFKKKWKYDNHVGHLYQSLRYYIKGHKIAEIESNLSDMAYCGINVALLYDLLARIGVFSDNMSEDGNDPFFKLFKEYSEEARTMRDKIVANYELDLAKLKKLWEVDATAAEMFNKEQRYWYFVTWAEALLGLGKFDAAAEKFKASLEKGNVPDWKKDASVAQCAELVELLFGKDEWQLSQAKQALSALVGQQHLPHRGIKYGLALSGGGFRASLFHIGVLAKLAEADLLRKVEVISCVSGGSILGAYYYLMLKKAVGEKGRDGLKKDDYIQLVKKLEVNFLNDINQNVRLNILSNLWDNIKMAFDPKYTRSSRTAMLYDRFLYSKLLAGEQVLMSDLMIKHRGEVAFNPIKENWKLESKVPILVLNATTLNTGHSWQFTSTYMGESPTFIGSEFDALPNLRRMYYDEAPENFRKVPLSKAVAASAGVPGLFAPIEFEGLYEQSKGNGNQDIRLLLVDGGVHDNQGISALYENECNMLIISDASGQMPEDLRPSSNLVNVVSRTNSILQERIRNSIFLDLEARKKSGVVHDFMLMHLTKGLSPGVIDWKGCNDPYVPPISQGMSHSILNQGWLDYGIKAKIQTLLASIRTDLDAFHESEAYSLMYSGYKMTGYELLKPDHSMLTGDSVKTIDGWGFMNVDKVQKDAKKEVALEAKLGPSNQLLGKLLNLSKPMKRICQILIVVLVLSALFGLCQICPIYIVAIILGVLLVEYFLLPKTFNIRTLLLFILAIVPIVLIGIISSLIKKWLTKVYLRAGKLP